MAAKRDRLSGYAEVVDGDSFKAWSQGNEEHWRICRDNQVYIEANFRTARKRKPSYTNIDSYRVETRHEVTFIIRGGYQQRKFTTGAYKFYGGEVATLRDILGMFKTGHLFTLAAMAIQDELRDKATSLQLIEADDIYDWQYDSLSDFDRAYKRFRQNLALFQELSDSVRDIQPR